MDEGRIRSYSYVAPTSHPHIAPVQEQRSKSQSQAQPRPQPPLQPLPPPYAQTPPVARSSDQHPPPRASSCSRTSPSHIDVTAALSYHESEHGHYSSQNTTPVHMSYRGTSPEAVNQGRSYSHSAGAPLSNSVHVCSTSSASAGHQWSSAPHHHPPTKADSVCPEMRGTTTGGKSRRLHKSNKSERTKTVEMDRETLTTVHVTVKHTGARSRTNIDIPDDFPSEPTPILGKDPGRASESAVRSAVHPPRTLSIQSLFKRPALTQYVKHYHGRHHLPPSSYHPDPPPPELNSNNLSIAESINRSNGSLTRRGLRSKLSQGNDLSDGSVTRALSLSNLQNNNNNNNNNNDVGGTADSGADCGKAGRRTITLEIPIRFAPGEVALGVQWQGKMKGIIVASRVKEGSPAARAGIQEGMRLIAVDGSRIVTQQDLSEAIGPEGRTMQKLRNYGVGIITVEATEDHLPLDGDTNSMTSYDVEVNVPEISYQSTYESVWLPCITAILANIAFLQLPLLVASVGVGWSLLVLGITIAIGVVTWISVAALISSLCGATKMSGPYLLLSRHLGTEFGGTVGVLYWLVFVVLFAVHSYSAGELVHWFMKDHLSALHNHYWGVNLNAWIIQMLIVFGVWRGVTYVSSFEALYTAVALLVVCLVSIGLITNSSGPSKETLSANWGSVDNPSITPIEAFCRVLPSSCGLLAAISRHADLEHSRRRLPKATMKAMGVVWTLLAGLILLIGAVMDRGSKTSTMTIPQEVHSDPHSPRMDSDHTSYTFLASRSWPYSPLTHILMVIAIIGQAMQAMLIAPRVLFYIAGDHVIPIFNPFDKCSGGEPRRALMVSVFIAGLLVFLQSHLHTATSLVLLICFSYIAAATALNAFVESPHWQPNLEMYSWKISAFGLVATLVAMFLIKWYYALPILIVSMAVAKYVEYQSDCSSWGDGVRGLQLQQSLEKLLSLEGQGRVTKNWRPQLLVLVKIDAEGRVISPRLLSVAEQLKMGKGLNIIAAVIKGNPRTKEKEVEKATEALSEQRKQLEIKGFCSVIVAPTYLDGCSFFVQGAGLGTLSPNTVLVAWPEDWQNNAAEFTELLQIIHDNQKALFAVKGVDTFPCIADSNLEDIRDRPLTSNTIDLWWIVNDGGIELLIAFLLRQHAIWKRCELRIFTIIHESHDSDQFAEDVSKLLSTWLKIDAILVVVPIAGNWINEFLQTHDVDEMKREQKQRENEKRYEEDEIRELQVRRAKQNMLETPTAAPSFHSPAPQEHTPSQFPSFPVVVLGNLVEEEEDVCDHFKSLNKYIQDHSRDTDLVLIGIPDPGPFPSPEDFMRSMDLLLCGIERAILIRGTGQEHIHSLY